MDNRVVLTGCANYDPEVVAEAFDRLFDPIGGLDWVKPGMRVAVKVNFVLAKSPEKAATTHPALVKELCRRLVEHGAEVTVGDSPGGPYNKAALETVYLATGMRTILETGAKLNEDFTDQEVCPPDAETIHSFRGISFLEQADAIVDFCKLKTHALMGYTGACKNMFGGIAGLYKTECHYRFPTHAQFASMLVDLCEYYKPVLSICDGVLAMEGNGPSFGDPRPMGVLAASFNPHALDLACCDLIGLQAGQVPTLAEAVRRGLCPETTDQLEIYGDPELFRVHDFKLQPLGDIQFVRNHNGIVYSFIKHFVTTRPVAGQECVGCGKCAAVCPEKAIVIHNRRPQINHRKCVSCFCCVEFCPQGTMRPFEPFTLRLLHKARKN